MHNPPLDWSAWLDEQRCANGLGVCCREAQADGVSCADPAGDCARCGRAYALYGDEIRPYGVGVFATPSLA